MNISRLINYLKLCRHYHQAENMSRRFVKKHACPPLTGDEKRQIDAYWAQFGIRIRDYSTHQMYYAVTGIHDPRFIPKAIFAYTILAHCNNSAQSAAYTDKNMFSRILPDMTFPQALGCRINHRYFDRNGVCYGEELTDAYIHAVYDAIRQEKLDAIIVKVAIGSCAGKGVRKYQIDSPESLRTALTEFNSPNFVIQVVIRQHPFFRQFNESSVNIIRCTTWRNGNDVHVFAPCIRYGISGSATDIAYRNGVEIITALAVSPDGRIHDHSLGLDGAKTPLTIEDRQVPQWEQILEKIKTEHRKLHHFDIVAWDITVNEQSEIVCIEYNLKLPGSVLYQFASGPLAGEHTDEFLACLRDPRIRRNLLPRSYKLPGFSGSR